MRRLLMTRFLLALIACAALAGGAVVSSSANQSSLSELQVKLNSQYAAIEEEIAAPPAIRFENPGDYKAALRDWQARLASRFSDAANTVEEIAKIDLANSGIWQER